MGQNWEIKELRGIYFDGNGKHSDRIKSKWINIWIKNTYRNYNLGDYGYPNSKKWFNRKYHWKQLEIIPLNYIWGYSENRKWNLYFIKKIECICERYLCKWKNNRYILGLSINYLKNPIFIFNSWKIGIFLLLELWNHLWNIKIRTNHQRWKFIETNRKPYKDY
jgi:hypothetical protein